VGLFLWENEMATRREDLAEALDAIEEGISQPVIDEIQPSDETSAPTVENITTEPAAKGERIRDESGRFAPKQPEAPDAQAVTASQPVAEVPAVAERAEAPKSWKADMKATWDKLDPQVASYISQREQEMSRGVEQERERLAPAVQLYQTVQPFVDEIRQMGRDPQADLRDLLHTRRLLATGDEATKLQTIVNVAHAVGIPLQQMLQQSAALPAHLQHHIDPAVMAAQNQARAAEFQLAQRQQMEQQQIQQQAIAQVEQFKASHPHVDELGPEMQRLLQAGLATDLDSAYSKALRLNDKLFQQTQTQQRSDAEKQRRAEADKAAKAAKANAVSTRSATPGSVAAATSGAPKGRRAALEASFDEATASRI
jgi:hypothetical protein